MLFINSKIINSSLRVLKWNNVCSQVLKEAKEVSEQKAAGEPEGTTPTVDLFSEFDKFQGLAHLEALEMLSRDSEAKVCRGSFITMYVAGVAKGCVGNPDICLHV